MQASLERIDPIVTLDVLEAQLETMKKEELNLPDVEKAKHVLNVQGTGADFKNVKLRNKALEIKECKKFISSNVTPYSDESVGAWLHAKGNELREECRTWNFVVSLIELFIPVFLLLSVVLWLNSMGKLTSCAAGWFYIALFAGYIIIRLFNLVPPLFDRNYEWVRKNITDIDAVSILSGDAMLEAARVKKALGGSIYVGYFLEICLKKKRSNISEYILYWKGQSWEMYPFYFGNTAK